MVMGIGWSPSSSAVYCGHLRVSLSTRWCQWVATRAGGEISHLAALREHPKPMMFLHPGSKPGSQLISLSLRALISMPPDQSRLLQVSKPDTFLDNKKTHNTYLDHHYLQLHLITNLSVNVQNDAVRLPSPCVSSHGPNSSDFFCANVRFQ